MRVLEIEATMDASRAESGFADVASAAEDMAREVTTASRKVEGAASRLDRVGESADDLDSKAAQATGSLGALSSGFELVGAEKYAGTLQAAALATDFMAGVGEGLNLITRLSIVQRARDAAAATLQAVANRAAAAATRAQAIAQRVLNVAMRANPIGLIITAVIALVALFVILYRRSDRVRGIVQTVGRVGRAALGWIVAAARPVVSWIADRIPGAARTAQTVARAVFSKVSGFVRGVVGAAKDVVTWVGKIPAKVQALRDKVAAVGSAITSPFRSLLGFIKDIVDWIGRIKMPKIDLPNIPGLGRAIPGAGPLPGAVVAGAPVSVVTNVGGIVDDATIRQIERAQTNALRRVGLVR